MATGASLVLDRDDAPEGAKFSFWTAALELGFWASAGAQLNTAALQQIGVARGAILLATINILTPLLSALIGTTERQRQVSARTWLACALALASTVVALSEDPMIAPMATSLKPGDELALGAACCYATQQVRLGSLVSQHDAQQLAAARLQTQAACSLVFLPLAARLQQPSTQQLVPAASESASQLAATVPPPPAADTLSTALSAALTRAGEWAAHLSATQAGLLVFSACVAVIGLLLQYEGQRSVPAASAQPIYAASPILSAVYALLALGEPITSGEAVGGLGIGGAALLALPGGDEEEGEVERSGRPPR